MSKPEKSPYRAMALVSVISSYIVVCTLAGVYSGLWLDERFDTTPLFLIVSIFTWLGVAFYAVFKTIQPYLGEDE
ncbi:AtpZ/AtpI family protein [Alkalihalobacillus sp. 1P02AB]|uniref:AtpZ/AtpI family protein n=1 Tax=Alkalihalobacillus sp. 1P02AB TaxID=3132260 RepID=UPI0039A6639F